MIYEITFTDELNRRMARVRPEINRDHVAQKVAYDAGWAAAHRFMNPNVFTVEQITDVPAALKAVRDKGYRAGQEYERAEARRESRCNY